MMEVLSATPNPDEKARYDAAKRELIQALTKKRAVDKALATLEVQIYNFEGSYLTETAQHSGGNIIQGFESYLKTQNVGRRRHEVTDADRVFSNSSLSYQKSLDLLGEGDEQENDGVLPISSGGSRGPTPGLTTVVLPAATQRNTQELSTAQQKKIRDKEYQRRKRAAAAQEKAAAAAKAAAADVEDDGSSSTISRRPSKKPRQADDD